MLDGKLEKLFISHKLHPHVSLSQICVPRAEVAAKMKLNRKDIENHILVPQDAPNKELQDVAMTTSVHFQSMNGKVRGGADGTITVFLIYRSIYQLMVK